ncbi:thermophilic serine proteinase precursor [bacterium BMS3Bbin14]|nr:thermophilic serine proteinase precursor [bacterium BMS3Bbin14]HDO30244.1 peptidase S8 [Desulfobacteraceae bacterium]
MKHVVRIASMVLVLFMLAATGWSGQAATGDPGNFMPNQLIIGFRPGLSNARIKRIVTRMGGRILGRVNMPRVKARLVRMPASTQEEIDANIAAVKKTAAAYKGKILYVEKNGIERAFRSIGDSNILSQSADPQLADQWGYYDTGANTIPLPSRRAPTVAVVDTGVDYNHPDLRGRVIKGRDFVNGDRDPMDDNGHGTHCAGIIAANPANGFGISGISWKSKILAVKVIGSDGWGTTFDVVQGIIYAARKAGVKVISLSLGGEDSPTKKAAVQYAVVTRKRLIVAAAGNSDTNSTTSSYPAAYAIDFPGQVLAVAAHGKDHCRASFSNYGNWISISAPGVDILSTVPPNQIRNLAGTPSNSGYGEWSGTSMATPFVAGAAAVLWAEHPRWTNTMIGDQLIDHSTKSFDPLNRDGTCWPADGSTFGRLNLPAAMEAGDPATCGFGVVAGTAMDAESGEPLAGATVYTKSGRRITGRDVVPWWGQLTDPDNQSLLTEGPGLFTITASPGGSDQDLHVVKKGYARPVFHDIPVPADCTSVNVGVLPVPPNRGRYFVTITWTEPNPTVAAYDLLAYLPDSQYIGWLDWLGANAYYNLGETTAYPWARYFWDSYSTTSILRSQAESIRLVKTLPGQTAIFVNDWQNKAGSTLWSTSGIQVFIYKWSGGGLKLVQQFSPAPGSGEFWYIADISGNKLTIRDFLTDTRPGSGS